MLSESKFLEILEQLAKHSKQNKVNWHRDVEPFEHFYVPFKDGSRITLQYFSPPSSSDWIRAALIARGNTVFQLHAEDGDPNYTLFASLLGEAIRVVTGWDSAVEQIERELSSGNIIGEVDDEDILF